jgi:eukaryotic-like serine/threonine-protein kinase
MLLRRPWRKISPWLMLASGGFLGIGGALLAALWLSAGYAASIGGAVTAVAAVLSARARSRLDQRWNVRRALPESLALRAGSGRLPSVKDVADPTWLGVHRAEALPKGRLGEAANGVPAYIPRDVDAELRSALRRGSFTVLVGESTAGKSRAAFEAMRSEVPDRLLAVPAGWESLAVVVTTLADRRPSVLWLDDLERFMGPTGLTPAMIADLTEPVDRDVIVLATMRASEYDRFAARREATVSDPDWFAWRASLEVLRRAQVITMNRLWSPSELNAAARFAGDPRIAKALEHAHLFGVAETLTAGPELVRDWRNAWAPGTHPRAAALVTAAVDCRRAGLDDPVSRDLLEKLHNHYLRIRGGHALRPEPLGEAWAWALQPVHGASSLIIPTGSAEESPKYLAFDYLLDLPDQEPVPLETWELLITHTDKAQAERVAGAAFWHVPVVALHAVNTGSIDNVFLRATAAAEVEDYTQAIRLLEDELQRAVTNNEPTQSLRHQIAFYNMLAGRASDAEAMFRELLAESEADLPEDDERLQVIRHNIASCTQRNGDLPSALLQFQRILADRERYLGPRAMNTLATRGEIASIIAKIGDPAEALRLTRELLADEEQALGKDNTNTLGTRRSLAEYMAQNGEVLAALDFLNELLPDLVRAFGDDHPEVLDCRWQMAQYAAQSGKRKDAQRLFQEVLADRNRLQTPESPKLVRQRREFETFLANST